LREKIIFDIYENEFHTVRVTEQTQ